MLALICLAAAGCDRSDAPAASYEMAAQGVFSAALSSDSELSLIGSLNHGGSLWRNTSHERLFGWNHQANEFSPLVAVAFSADGTRAVTTDPRTLVVWDTASGNALAYWTTPAAVLDVALVAGGSQVLMGLEDHSAVLFDAGSGRHLHTFLHDGVVGAVDASLDGRWALTGSDDETAVIWNLQTGAPVHRLQHDNPVRVVALSARGSYAFTASQGRRVAVWDGQTGQPLLTLSEHNEGVTSARFSADERYLLVGYVNRRVALWDLSTGKRLHEWRTRARNPMHPTGAAILAVGFSSSPSRFFALAGDGRLVELRLS